MSRRARDLTGCRFGSWRAVSPAPRDHNNMLRWHCVCDCGTRGVVYQCTLLKAADGYGSISCGCSRLARRPIRVGRSLPPVVVAGAAASLFTPTADAFAEIVASMRSSRGRRRQLGSMS